MFCSGKSRAIMRAVNCSLTCSPVVLTLGKEVLPAQAFGRKPNETAFVLMRATDLGGMLEYRSDK